LYFTCFSAELDRMPNFRGTSDLSALSRAEEERKPRRLHFDHVNVYALTGGWLPYPWAPRRVREIPGAFQ